MPIVVDIDVMPANLAVLKNGRAKAVRFATLAALCQVLRCQPGDLLRWEPDTGDGRDTVEGTSASLSA
jgi:putative transcriptional regulator